MEVIRADVSSAYMDAVIIGPFGEPLFVSFFERSAQLVRSVGASLVLNGAFHYKNRIFKNNDKFSVSYNTMVKGKERYTHAVAVACNITSDYLVTTEEDLLQDLFAYLMERYDFPILEAWMPEILDCMRNGRYLYTNYKSQVFGNRERCIKKSGKDVPLSKLQIYSIRMKEENLKDVLSMLLKAQRIRIASKPQKSLEIGTMDTYFKNYGKTIVQNLQRILKPVSELNGEIDRICLNTIRLYPQQAAMVNGVYEYFRKRHKYVLFCMGTGSGKTIQAASAAEMQFVGKWLREHPDKTLADAYEQDGIIHYRHIIMCPGHLVEKWKAELLREIPYAKPVIIESFQQLVALRAAGKERRDGKEYYIISKDFCKLSYQRIPVPKKQATRLVEVFKCKKCGVILPKKGDSCPVCGTKDIVIAKTNYKRHGLICPNCNRLLFPQGFTYNMEAFEDPEDGKPMHWYDMAYEKQGNQNCIYCNESLWMPFVRNVNAAGIEEAHKPAWIRQTFWANKARKGKNTIWVLKGYEKEAELIFGKPVNSMDQSLGGCRKYSPAMYVKKFMKGYFDIFIADEVHKAKGGATAQGNAFHSIVKASRYTYGLTGTIAGGVATDLFYLLFRLDPARMVARGYKWGNVMQFAEEYGCIEQSFQPIVDERRNTFSRGRQLSPPRVLPGISPCIFSEFLLDRAVFLDIPDMSANMPPLHEHIVLCRPESDQEKEMILSYKEVIRQLKIYARESKINLMAVSNQFSMSYLDKPYGVPEIRNPKTGDEILTPEDFRILVSDGQLLPKERELLKIVRQELKEGRNCVIYAEYSQSETTNVLPRLKEILMEHLELKTDEVVIMRADTPKASQREKWMHEKAESGMRIMLCNPRLCETGLDFCWKENGRIYNYPTLVFYQCGYSLFIIWQAAGRSWRLNQREECRTFYLAYENTVQQAILQVLGEKKAATAAIQGHFSADGLAAVARGVDTQMRIAQIMSEMDESSGNKLQQMFDAIIDESKSTYGNCRKMKLFKELVAAAENMAKEQPGLFESFGAGNIFEVFDQILQSEEESENAKTNMTWFTAFGQMHKELLNTAFTGTSARKKRKKEKAYEGCALSW